MRVYWHEEGLAHDTGMGMFDQPETVQITLGVPGRVSQTAAHGKLANRIHRERRRLL